MIQMPSRKRALSCDECPSTDLPLPQPRRSSRARVPPEIARLLYAGLDFPQQADVFSIRGIDKSAFIVHQQGDRGTCCAHATTAMHEITRFPKQFNWEDLFEQDWDNDEKRSVGDKFSGALIAECCKKLATQGQKERKGDEVHTLLCSPVIRDLKHIKQRLLAGSPIAIALHIFRADATNFTVENHSARHLQHGDGQWHAVCLVSYTDDDEWEGGGCFEFVNSYGKRWGTTGFGTMSYSFFLTFVHEAYAPMDASH